MEHTSAFLKDLEESFDETRLKEGQSHASALIWSKIKQLLGEGTFIIELADEFISLIF